ncbi:MAG TPA: hypothetical protein VMT52_09275 [Planctomycetota bacterium]|nr:hypothetical protein [Planctomycetota bacterium]
MALGIRVDGETNITDSEATLDWLFLGEPDSGCVAVTDTNGDERTEITNPIHVLGHLFLGGPAPALPFSDCGTGSDAGRNRCETPPSHGAP